MRNLTVLALLSLVCMPAHAQHLGARVQWQSEISDTDARLQQPVDIEILGRAAIPALELLSDAAGVSLTVAPKDLNTVGERKLIIIAQGCTLKALLVQLPEALQECHWDIDASGEKPVYLLHQNSGMEAVVGKLRADRRAYNRAKYEAERIAARASRIEAARQALQMSPHQLAQLEETDLILSRAAQVPATREMMEIFFSLSDEDMEQFSANGKLEFPYEHAPPGVRRLPQLIVELGDRYVAWVESWPAEERHPSGHTIEEMRIEMDSQNRQLTQLSDTTITLSGDFGGITVQTGAFALPIILPPNQDLGGPLGGLGHFLLAQTGYNYRAALDTIAKWTQERQEEMERDQSNAWEKRLGPEPADPRLLHTISILGEEDWVALLDIQNAIAAQTGLSVLSDSFPCGGSAMLPREELEAEMPLWHILTYLTLRGVEWSLAGDCLVFHRRNWYDLSEDEAAAERNAADTTAPQRPAE